MLKNLFLIIIFISILSMLKTENVIYEKYDEEQYFKELVKNYLIEKNLWESDKLIQPDEIRKLFIDVINEGEYMDNKLKNVFDKVINYFIEKYYKEKKDIKGKDLINIINIKELMQKYYELNGESPIYDDDYIFNDDNLNIENNNNDFDL